MKYLVDTNIFLEIILGQKKSDLARKMLMQIQDEGFAVSLFSLHSIGVFLIRTKKYDDYLRFLSDMGENPAVKIVTLSLADMDLVVGTAKKLSLDFDDAYQYVAAEKYDLTVVSFDGDFDRTPRGRKTPEIILEG